MDRREKDEATLREHWEPTAIFTDSWPTDHYDRQEQGAEFQKLLEDELLPGELSAVTCRVGCYIVRKAWRVYNVYEWGYSPEMETPAEEADVELVRKDLDPDGSMNSSMIFSSWWNRLRVTEEISARHCDSPNSEFIYICRATEARSLRWSEKIGPIYAAKASIFVPDEYASLLVCLTFLGDSHTDDNWYRLDPTGKITKFTTNSSS